MKNTLLFGFLKSDAKVVWEQLEANGDLKISLWIDNESFDSYSDESLEFSVDESVERRKLFESFHEDVFHSYFYLYEHLLSADALDEGVVCNSHIRYRFHMIYNHFLHLLKDGIPDLAVFDGIPHVGPDLILYGILKALKVPVLIFNESEFKDKFTVFDSIESIGKQGDFVVPSEPMKAVPGEINSRAEVLEPSVKFPSYSRWDMLSDLYKNIINKKSFYYVYMQKHSQVQEYIYRLEKAVSKDVLLTDPYVYFPLALQPSMNTCPLAGIYRDQLLAVESLLSSLPKGWKIIIQEDAQQTQRGRGEWFFNRLEILGERVVLVERDYSREQLIKNSEAVASSGTPLALAALKLGKPLVLFGHAWYETFPGVNPYRDALDWASINLFEFNESHLNAAFNAFSNHCFGGGISSQDLASAEREQLAESIAYILKNYA